MGIFGRREEKNNEIEQILSTNEEVIKSVVSEIKQEGQESTIPKDIPEVVVQERIQDLSEVKAKQAVEKVGEIYKGLDDRVSRRRFLEILATGAAGGLLAACTRGSSENNVNLPSLPMESEMEEEEKENYENIYVKDPIRLNANEFVKGVSEYPNAIIERSQISKNDRGEPLFIRYGGQFNEVTYLHYTGQIPPVVGEILPFMYKLPQDMKGRVVDIVPYAITVQSEIKKIDFNDSQNHYVIPIVTSGNDSGIVQRMENGPSKAFEVVPDGVSGNTKGFLSWAILTEIGNELVLEGVSIGNSGIYIDQSNVPEEIQSLLREN